MNCNDCKSHLPDLLLDASAVPANVQTHLASCDACAEELLSLEQTFGLLDAWEAPEPSVWFDQKLAYRLREEQARPHASWFEKVRSYVLYNTGRQFRPAVAGAFALVLLVGGGTFAGMNGLPHGSAVPEASATVNDLQIFDKNAQTVQQLDQLLQDDGSPDDNPASQPAS